MKKKFSDIQVKIVIPDSDSDQIALTRNFWDCVCDENYHRKESEDFCSVCGAEREERPDARVIELSDDNLAAVSEVELRFSVYENCSVVKHGKYLYIQARQPN